MTTRERSHHETLDHVRRLLARARPEQVRRLLEDIRSSDKTYQATARMYHESAVS
jgi:hypothetical protein